MKSFEEWYTSVFGGHITENQATDELRTAYDYYVENEKLRNDVKGLKYHLSQTAGRRGVCLEFGGKDMTDVYELQREIAEKDTIINFLKKELIHKTCYRQVMKRQYRELKQQKKCNCTICRFERKEISVLKYAQELGELLFAAVKDKCLADVKEGKMQPSTAKRVIDYLEKPYADIKDDKYSIPSWHFLKENPKDLPRNEGWVCNQDGLPCRYDIANDQWIDCEGTQIKTTAWCDMPHTKE